MRNFVRLEIIVSEFTFGFALLFHQVIDALRASCNILFDYGEQGACIARSEKELGVGALKGQ